jgi:hypothetical protein
VKIGLDYMTTFHSHGFAGGAIEGAMTTSPPPENGQLFPMPRLGLGLALSRKCFDRGFRGLAPHPRRRLRSPAGARRCARSAARNRAGWSLPKRFEGSILPIRVAPIHDLPNL